MKKIRIENSALSSVMVYVVVYPASASSTSARKRMKNIFISTSNVFLCAITTHPWKIKIED
jgi:hypothetical protein